MEKRRLRQVTVIKHNCNHLTHVKNNMGQIFPAIIPCLTILWRPFFALMQKVIKGSPPNFTSNIKEIQANY